MEKICAKIIAIDLDDTLLRDDLSISSYTCDILSRVAASGIYVIPASGRTTDGICRFADKLGLIGLPGGRYVIGQNGSEIFDRQEEKTIFSAVIPKNIVPMLEKIIANSSASVTVYDKGEIFTSKDTPWSRLDQKLTGFKFNPVEDFFRFLQEKSFHKIVIGDDREKLRELKPKLQEALGDKAIMCFSKPYFLEILPLEGGKGNALRHLTEQILGFSSHDVMCFGDSFNDETMLKYAFNSVAMVNGGEEIRALSRFITDFSNNDDGVARFLEKHLDFNKSVIER